MEQSESRIEELKSQIYDNNAELKQIYEAAGEKVADGGLFKGDDARTKELLEKVNSLDAGLKDVDSRMDDLRSTYNRISEIADREKAIGEEYSLLEKENKKLFVPMGRSAYGKLKESDDKAYGKTVAAVAEAESRLDELDSELFRLESKGAKKGLINSLKDKSRSVVLKSKKKSSLSSLEAHFAKLGEKIYKKDPSFFTSVSDDSVAPFVENRKKLESLDKEIQELKNENGDLEKHLKSQFNSSKRKKSEEKLQSVRDLALSDKMAGLKELGEYLYLEKITIDNKEVKDFFSSADALLEKNDKLNEEVERCKAEMEIEKLNDEISDMKKNIKELEMTIEKCNSDISEFNTEIKRARAEIRKLKKLTEKGAEETVK